MYCSPSLIYLRFLELRRPNVFMFSGVNISSQNVFWLEQPRQIYGGVTIASSFVFITYAYLNCKFLAIFYIFTWFLLTLFSSLKVQFLMLFRVSNTIQIFQNDWVESTTQSNLFIYNSCSADYPLFSQIRIPSKLLSILASSTPVYQYLTLSARGWRTGYQTSTKSHIWGGA